jgi:hypothetical protein
LHGRSERNRCQGRFWTDFAILRPRLSPRNNDNSSQKKIKPDPLVVRGADRPQAAINSMRIYADSALN